MRLFVCGLIVGPLWFAATVWGADLPSTPFLFQDVSQESGVLPSLAGMRGHGAAWGDVNGDGYPELFVTTFHTEGSPPAVLLRNNGGQFSVDPQPHLRVSGIGSGALFVDLANQGRLDLYISHCIRGKVAKVPQDANPNVLMRNDGEGRFTDVTASSGASLPGFAGRGIAALDFDGDGLLDLIGPERYYGKVEHGPVLFRNRGGHQFENISAAAGLPPQLSGLAVAVADMNEDGLPDIFLTEGTGDHRLYLNDGKKGFREAPGTREVFHWSCPTSEDTPAGVAIADVNRDGLPDILIGQHFKRPWIEPVAVRLYLHQGVKNGNPSYVDVTEAAGLAPLRMKAPHVEIQDFDNDGWPDIYLSVVKFRDGRPYPLIYKNLGTTDGIPRFSDAMWQVNDFPNEEERAIQRTGTFFERLLQDKRATYVAAAPSADYNRDGRLDLLLATWFTEEHCLLLRNETSGGHWLQVAVEGPAGVNRMGVGARVRVYPAGKKDASSLLGDREIQIGYGYCSGQEALAHFGLGKVEQVDVYVSLPHGKGSFERKNVRAEQRITIGPKE